MLFCFGISFDGIASALHKRPTVWAISFSDAYFVTSITSNFIASLVSSKSLTCLDLRSSNISNELLYSIAIEGLPLTRLCLYNCKGYSYAGVSTFPTFGSSKCCFLIDKHVVELSLFMGDLVSINLSRCSLLTIFALINSCPSLSDIKMEQTSIGKKSLESSKSLMDFTAHPQLKYLRLAWNPWLTDENIIMFASISPNLQLLGLSSCGGIEEGIAQVVRMCCNIRHLNLSHCSRMKLVDINFEVPKLEVLNLSYTNVDDQTLYMISKNCRGLLQLLLEYCTNVTEMGVKHVVENCRQLRLIK